MDFISILLIAIGLSFDSFAVSVSSGLALCRKTVKVKTTILIAGTLAVFQGTMPVVGWFLGRFIRDLIEHLDHWVAFSLLLFLGVRMIREGMHPVQKIKNPTHWKVLLTMSVATSVDALAVGISMALFIENMLYPATLIAIVTFVISMIGLYMGRKTGKMLAGKGEMVGGIILILIGLKILIEHMFAHGIFS